MLYIILHTVSSNFFRALYRLIQSKKHLKRKSAQTEHFLGVINLLLIIKFPMTIFPFTNIFNIRNFFYISCNGFFTNS